ncbi:hypothetical protein [Telluribacter sp.]|jgi:hypothetical protein|uniref:hypothetical protein n=1 Tax=Telluribacter sp. TaxID=1978767 RepID=UPI002E12AB3D|nr:hypothetical protein [Telluribacter sp.]
MNKSEQLSEIQRRLSLIDFYSTNDYTTSNVLRLIDEALFVLKPFQDEEAKEIVMGLSECRRTLAQSPLLNEPKHTRKPTEAEADAYYEAINLIDRADRYQFNQE